VRRGATELSDLVRIVDDVAALEPPDRLVEARQALRECTGIELECVQKVEGRLQIDVGVDMVRGGRMERGLRVHITTLRPLTGYAQDGIVTHVTIKTTNTGYEMRKRRHPMEILTTLLAIVVALIGFDLAAVTWGADSRDQLGDDHAR
jgi:hypothetical protein